MANTIISTNTVTSTAVTLDSNDNFLLLDGASYVNTSTTDGITINPSASNADIIINGDYIYLGNRDAIRGIATINNTVITVSDTGSIVADGNKEIIFLQGDNTTVTNDGFMSGAAVTITGANTDFYNNGTIRGLTNFTTVFLTGADTYLDNTGIISGDSGVRVGDNGRIINSGEISATNNAVYGAGTVYYLFNSGLIASDDGLAVGSDFDAVANIINAGQIVGDVNIRGENSSITNTGDIFGLVNITDGAARFNGRDSNSANEVQGGFGTDTLIGGASDDDLDGGADNDRLFGNDGDDTLMGNGGEDTVYGGAGDDDIQTGEGNDMVKAGTGDDVVTAGPDNGNDTIYGQSGNDDIDGGGGFDVLHGGHGDDTLSGGGRSDILEGSVGDDRLIGGGGGDMFVFKRGNNGDDIVVDFQDGIDRLDISDLGVFNFGRITTAGAISQDTDAAIIDLSLIGGNGSITLLGLQANDLSGVDFIF